MIRLFGVLALSVTASVLLAADAENSPDSSEISGVAVPETEVESLELLGRWYQGPVYGSTVAVNHIYLGSGGAVQVMKIEVGSASSSPQWTEVAKLKTSGIVRDLEAKGDNLYIADDGGALRIVDISIPASPRERAHVDLPKFVRAVSLAGDYAYLATGWQGLTIVDVSNPDQPRLVGSLKSVGYITDVHVDGSVALVVGHKTGHRIVDVSDPLNPKEIGHHDMPGQAHVIYASDGNAYVVSLDPPEGTGTGGLTTFDISTPANPTQLAFEQLIYGAERVWVEGSHAYVAGVANDAGLIIVDVSSPSDPLRLGSYTSPTCSESVTIAGPFAYLSHGDAGLEIIDLSQPLKPTVSQHVDTAGHVRGGGVTSSGRWRTLPTDIPVSGFSTSLIRPMSRRLDISRPIGPRMLMSTARTPT